MTRLRKIGMLALALAAGSFVAASAHAAMGGAAIMQRLHPKTAGELTLDEIRDAAGRAYDTIAKANGGKVTLLQVGGRVSPDDLKSAQIGDGARDEPISKADYLALASRFFAEANVSRKADVSPADGTLSVKELSTPAGEKLIRLLE